MYQTTTPTPALSDLEIQALLCRARKQARTRGAKNRPQLRALIAEIEATYLPGPVATAVLNARTDADLLAVVR